ncbi:MAG: polysaccharide biosynthesis/export family protein [Bacteroidales bacterium]|jgi:polysaccharide export outer membrane protein
MKKRDLLLVAAASLILASCGSTKGIPYLADVDNLSQYELDKAAKIYEAKIMPKDILTISVNTVVPEAAAPFNLGSNAGSGVGTTGSYVPGAALQTFIVDKEGYLEYPVVGKIKVLGLTREELQNLIKNRIYPEFITEPPIVNVRFTNYKISVLGEVTRPGLYTIQSEQCTIFDALALAGDLTIYGKRENILLLREDSNGKKSITRINLQNSSLLTNLNTYYLQQNDVLYIEPNKTKAKGSNIGSAESITISVISTLVSVSSLIYTIIRTSN